MICTYCHDDTGRGGWVRANTLAGAFSILGDDVTVYPLGDDAEWPGDPGGSIWTDAQDRRARRQASASPTPK